MAGLTLDGVTKAFGGHRAVDAVDLAVADGEFLALLGPSGCGKTTLLRLIAGFETADAGTIAFGSRPVSGPGLHVEPEDRNVGIVFQSYALWPHMDVAGNVGYALKLRGEGREACRRKVEAALAAVDLAGFSGRRPAELSGGQRQRVALARCLAMQPAVMLLDEPLANLDVHLRAQMEAEFRAVHARAGATTVYITHDQGEAMALADRIAVMAGGRIVQVADPPDLYRRPATAMVAGFVGQGAVVAGSVLRSLGGRARVALLGGEVELPCRDGHPPGPCQVSLRPEDLEIAADGLAATVAACAYRGGHWALTLAAGDARLLLLHGRPAAIGDSVPVAVRDGWIIPHA
ncbi:MAG: ABC transporter ATP-binding protein [Thalassobaculales bacterium]